MSEFLDKTGLSYFWGKLKTLFESKADGNTAGVALNTEGIPFGHVDSTSTATEFTATVPGITEYKDGTVVMLKNGVVTSTTNFTLNINGLGAKPCYTNLAAATRDTTIFNSAYTMLFVYDSTRVSGGAWICYRGYDANTNTIGYMLRTNSTTMTVTDTARYYKIYFTSADGSQWVPASVNSTNNATSARPVNQRPIDPFGRIVHTSANTNYTAGSNLAATTIWDQYALVLGYSFNRTGAALSLTTKTPVYVKCAPQADGSAIMDADTPIVQALPSTADGKIYIYLGVAYDATHIELYPNHPVYYYKDGAIRLWTNAEASGGGAVDSVNGQTGTVVLDATDVGALPDTTTIPTKTSDLTNDSGFVTSSGVTSVTINTSAEPYDLPITNGNAKLDIGDGLSASDASNKVTLEHKTGAGWKHIPSGGSAGQFLGYSSSGTATWQTPPTPTVPSAATANPLMDGTAAVGSSAKYAKEDHVHPTDTSRQATLVSGTNIKTINGNSLLGSGDLPVSGLPTITATDNGKVLMVVNGAWAAASLPVYDGSVLPSASGVSF